MPAVQLSEHAVDLFDRNFMDRLFFQFSPDRVKQKRPELPILFSIGTFDTGNDHRKWYRNSGRVSGGRKPRIACRRRWLYFSGRDRHSRTIALTCDNVKKVFVTVG